LNDAPIILNASVQMERGNGGLDVDLSAMQTTSRNWLRIDELRVFIDPGIATTGTTGVDADVDLGTMVDVAISVGGEELTTGFIGTPSHPTGERIAYIPAFLLGPRIYRRFSTINNNNAGAPWLTRPYVDQNSYSWVLPKPLFVPPGTPIKFKVRRTGTVNYLDPYQSGVSTTFDVEVAAVGVRLAKRPILTSRCLPHLHAWSPRNNNAARVESGEAFRNLHLETLNLTRLIGATVRYGGQTIITNTFSTGRGGGTGGQANRVVDPTEIQIYDADNQDVLVPNPPVPLTGAPVAQVPISRILLSKMNAVRFTDKLRPNQTIRVIVSPVIASDVVDQQEFKIPMLSLESYREVRMP
jgi:hypothetical protein